MPAAQPLRFTIHQTGDEKLIELFTERLSGRTFDFEYQLADMSMPIVIENQRISTDLPVNPIRLEYRERGHFRCECLVFVVEDPDDLTITIPNKMLDVDLCKEQDGIIRVKNDDGEKYRFIIKRQKK